MFDLEKENKNISQLCDYIDRMNALNPDNPGGISDNDLEEPIDQDYPYGEWDLIEQHNQNMKEYLDYVDLKNEEEIIVMFGGIN